MLDFFLIVGLISIIVSVIFSGAMVSGDRQRANYHTETSEDRNLRTKVALVAALIAVISFGIAGLIHYSKM